MIKAIVLAICLMFAVSTCGSAVYMSGSYLAYADGGD